MQNQMMIEKLVQYTHLEKLYGYLPGIEEALLAQLFGLNSEEYREIRDRFDEGARDAALELLEDAYFAGRVVRLPFREGGIVVGVGDSITDNLQSWLECGNAGDREVRDCWRVKHVHRRHDPGHQPQHEPAARTVPRPIRSARPFGGSDNNTTRGRSHE